MSRRTTSTLPRFAGGAAALAVFAAALSVAAAPGTAAASGPQFGPFGMTPSPAPSGAPRSYFSLGIAPGRTVSESVVVTNLSRKSERLRLTVSRGVTAANSGSAYENITGRCAGPSCWIVRLPRSIVLGPREVRLAGFAVHVPRRTRPGQYLVGVSALAAKKPRSVTIGSRGRASAKAVVVDEVTVGVAITVGRLSRLRSHLRVGQVSAEWIGSVPRLSIPVSDTGQTFLRGTGWIRCQAGAGPRSYRVIMQTMLPGGDAVLAVNARGLQAGALSCRLQMSTDNGLTVRWSGTVTLAARVMTKTYHPRKGVVISLPQSTAPLWALILIGLGILILFALLLLLIQRHRSASSASAG